MKDLHTLTDTYTLSNGYEIPCIGFGTFQIPDGDVCVESVKDAIDIGYRHIDGAAVYANEKSVGEGIKKSGIDRKELFITSKVWNTQRGYDTTIRAFEKTCADLGVSYLDLYLIHWPASSNQFENWVDINKQTWQAMIDLYKDGKIKSIGVSNFLLHHIEPLMEMEVKPMVNQIEFHPGLMWKEVYDFCIKESILVEAYSPLGSGALIENETLKGIASKYGKSTAQLLVRWVLEHDVLPLPKSTHKDRILSNIDVFDFSIDASDMEAMDAMEYCGGLGNHPDKVDF